LRIIRSVERFQNQDESEEVNLWFLVSLFLLLNLDWERKKNCRFGELISWKDSSLSCFHKI
jgi:hypothetical protein